MVKIRITAPAPDHAQLGGLTADNHHTQAHVPESHTGQGATAAELETLTDGSVDVALHTHVDNPAAAGQSQLESEVAGGTFVGPNLVRHSPGVSKGWCRFTSAGALESPDYNVASITDTGTGDRTIVWDDDFSTAVYAVAVSDDEVPVNNHIAHTQIDTFAVGSVRFRQFQSSGGTTAFDRQGSCVAYGDQ